METWIRPVRGVIIATALTAACGSSGPGGPTTSGSPPSCQTIPTPCSSLSTPDGLPMCETYRCTRHFSCAGSASCDAATTSMASSFPDLNCRQSSPGCTWDGMSCTGTPLPCSDAMYQQNSVACENVGCVLTTTCEGGNLEVDCNSQTSPNDCYNRPYCQWK